MGNPSDGKILNADEICEGCQEILIGEEKGTGLCIDCSNAQNPSSNIMGGDTGVDADFAHDGYVCYVCTECCEDIDIGEEVEVYSYLYCPECVKKGVDNPDEL